MKTLYEKMRDNRKRMHFNELKVKVEQQARECREREERLIREREAFRRQLEGLEIFGQKPTWVGD